MKDEIVTDRASIAPEFDQYDRDTLQAFRRALRAWYRRRARELPWRKSGEAYRIWISEIMLQQTTVTAVVPYFERFTERFPSIQVLASAEQDEVLRYWEGLGYYSRARNIHKTAMLLVEEREGVFPQTVDELMALPGIGRYTAGAIMSFAFDLPAPILEANTIRVYSRLLGYEENPRSTRGQRILWSFAEHLLPRRSVGPFNQGLMELGALVCTPTEPKCCECPVRSTCRAFADGRQDEIPQAEKRPEVTSVVEVSAAVRLDGRFVLRRNPEGQRWAGLWDFIRFPLSEHASLIPENGLRKDRPLPLQLQRLIEQTIYHQIRLGTRCERLLAEIRHSVTRYRIRLQCVLAEGDGPIPDEQDDLRLVAPDDFDDVPFSTTGRKLANLLLKEQQQRGSRLFEP